MDKKVKIFLQILGGWPFKCRLRPSTKLFCFVTKITMIVSNIDLLCRLTVNQFGCQFCHESYLRVKELTTDPWRRHGGNNMARRPFAARNDTD